MKLLFPNGEHEPVDLQAGETLVGSSNDCQVMLAAPGIAVRHCALRSEAGKVVAVPLDAQATTVLNGRQIAAETPLKPGDLLLFARIGCRVVASEKATPPSRKPLPVAAMGEDDGHTRVRMALPKYLLRGVSGPTFGKTFGVVGSLTIGRSNESDICIPTDEISRHHAKLQVVPDGVVVEDMGSANGTFVNNQRVHTPTLLKGGDELRLDTIRFLLMAPGMEAHVPVTARNEVVAPVVEKKSSSAVWIIMAVIVLAVVAVAVLRYLGKI